MPPVSKEAIQKLRAETGAPLLECRKALEDAGGNAAKARELLRERGKLVAAKKGERPAREGTIGVYVHNGGRVAGMVLLRCETDFVAQNPVFQELARDLAMQVVAMNPAVLRPEETPAGDEAKAVAFLAQPFVKDASGKTSVSDLLAAKILQLGEKIVVAEFTRLAT